jgi:hypothetical protein
MTHCEKILEDNQDISDIAFEATEDQRGKTRNH